MAKKYLDGLDKAERTLRVMPTKTQQQLVRGLNRYRLEMEKRAEALAPGSIKRAVGSELREVNNGSGIESRVFVDDFRAGWIEFGTQPHSLARGASVERGRLQGVGGQHPGSNAQPFFWPAVRGVKKRARSGVLRALRKAAKELANVGR